MKTPCHWGMRNSGGDSAVAGAASYTLHALIFTAAISIQIPFTLNLAAFCYFRNTPSLLILVPLPRAIAWFLLHSNLSLLTEYVYPWLFTYLTLLIQKVNRMFTVWPYIGIISFLKYSTTGRYFSEIWIKVSQICENEKGTNIKSAYSDNGKLALIIEN